MANQPAPNTAAPQNAYIIPYKAVRAAFALVANGSKSSAQMVVYPAAQASNKWVGREPRGVLAASNGAVSAFFGDVATLGKPAALNLTLTRLMSDFVQDTRHRLGLRADQQSQNLYLLIDTNLQHASFFTLMPGTSHQSSLKEMAQAAQLQAMTASNPVPASILKIDAASLLPAQLQQMAKQALREDQKIGPCTIRPDDVIAAQTYMKAIGAAHITANIGMGLLSSDQPHALVVMDHKRVTESALHARKAAARTFG